MISFTSSIFSSTSLSSSNKLSVLFNLNCVKSVRIRSYSGQHFPTFGQNKGRYGISHRIQSECRKMRTRITPNTDTSHTVLYWSSFDASLYWMADKSCKYSYLNNFEDWVNPFCSCGQEVETSPHFLLNCPNYNCARETFEKFNNIDSGSLKQTEL